MTLVSMSASASFPLTHKRLSLLSCAAGMSAREICEFTGWVRADVDRCIDDWHLLEYASAVRVATLVAVGRRHKISLEYGRPTAEDQADAARKKFRGLLLRTLDVPWDQLESLDDVQLGQVVAWADGRTTLENQIGAALSPSAIRETA